MENLSIIINTMNRSEGLRLCLAALEFQTLDPRRWEVLVVDDGSRDPDATRQAVATWKGAATCRLILRDHGGCAAARNTGIDAAKHEIILFLGDDILCEPDLLEQHLRAHECREDAVIVGPYTWDRKVPSNVFLEYIETRRFDRISDPENASWRFLYTGNASVHRKALIEIGGFDENFIRYAWEDMDLGVRLEKAGLRVVYCPQARARHHHPHVSLRSMLNAEYEQSFSAWYFFQKWSGDPEIQADRFWSQPALEKASRFSWRRGIGAAAVHCAEFLHLPDSALKPLYERLVWAWRYAGLRDGARHYASIPGQPSPACRSTIVSGNRAQK